MKVKLDRLGTALDHPAEAVRLFLFHGPDEAGAMALAERLGRAMGTDAERVSLDGAALKGDPARLVDEAAAISLFGTPRWIRVTAAGEESLPAIEALLSAPAVAAPVAVIAPTVRATAKIVKLAEASPSAMAFGCYRPDERAGGAIVGELARAAGLRLAPGVAQRLFAAADGDRALLAREIDKLALYLDAAPDLVREVDEEARRAVAVGEGEGTTDLIVAALVAQAPRDMAPLLATMLAAEESPIPLLRAAVRRLMAIAELHARMDAGETPDRLLANVFFKEREATAAALRRWTSVELRDALTSLRSAERAIMASGSAGALLAYDTLLTLSGPGSAARQEGAKGVPR